MEKITVPPVLKDPKNKPEFPEDALALKHVDPLAPSIVTWPDWAELARLLGEPEAEAQELAEAAREIDRERLVKVVTEIFRFALAQNAGRGDRVPIIGRRLLALAWVVNPALFEGASAREVARTYGLSKTCLCDETGSASRQFGIRNRSQAHAGNFNPDGIKPANTTA